MFIESINPFLSYGLRFNFEIFSERIVCKFKNFHIWNIFKKAVFRFYLSSLLKFFILLLMYIYLNKFYDFSTNFLLINWQRNWLKNWQCIILTYVAMYININQLYSLFYRAAPWILIKTNKTNLYGTLSWGSCRRWISNHMFFITFSCIKKLFCYEKQMKRV